MTTEEQQVSDEADVEEQPTLSVQLLRFHDDLNAFLSKQEFYSEAIAALIEREDSDVLNTDRQRSGLMSIDRDIRHYGNELSERLDAIRKQIGNIGKQLN
ncbi:MAG: hypothetical protein KUF77_09825 [Candidatus Thiodiazotropha sp. (ex Lucina aurantia)]|nr:hypothetical protein [Candidatus Thiodiazotropha taylori]MBV2097819.1 hypothetical protein [Candidatus Thiodiazotropha sp. (ex Codakia orbicularis)]MBV2103308.1 hypothetical protein [Candidatus Thiodiazotropha sp. (ex Lucina aurantia)]MBV2116329.1 hypothetical protein [Candidatus Thiodiazotropha sp. (ex Lucina aurantia)]